MSENWFCAEAFFKYYWTLHFINNAQLEVITFFSRKKKILLIVSCVKRWEKYFPEKIKAIGIPSIVWLFLDFLIKPIIWIFEIFPIKQAYGLIWDPYDSVKGNKKALNKFCCNHFWNLLYDQLNSTKYLKSSWFF